MTKLYEIIAVYYEMWAGLTLSVATLGFHGDNVFFPKYVIIRSQIIDNVDNENVAKKLSK